MLFYLLFSLEESEIHANVILVETISQMQASSAAYQIQQSLQCVRNKGPFINADAHKLLRISCAHYDFLIPGQNYIFVS